MFWLALAALSALPPAPGPDPGPSNGVSVTRAADDRPETEPVPVPEPTPLAVRYHRTGVWVWAFARVWNLTVPAVVLLSGLSTRLRDVAGRWGRVWVGTVAVYVVLYLAVDFAADLP